MTETECPGCGAAMERRAVHSTQQNSLGAPVDVSIVWWECTDCDTFIDPNGNVATHSELAARRPSECGGGEAGAND